MTKEEEQKLLDEVAEKLKGRILFPEQLAMAKELLKNIKGVLPNESNDSSQTHIAE